MLTRIAIAAILILAACDTAGADACTTPTPPATTGPEDTGDTGATGDTTGTPEMTQLGDFCLGADECSIGQLCLLPWSYCSGTCDPAIGAKDCENVSANQPPATWSCQLVIDENLCVRKPI